MKLSVFFFFFFFFNCMLFIKKENANIFQDVNLLKWAKMLLCPVNIFVLLLRFYLALTGKEEACKQTDCAGLHIPAGI